MVKKYGTALALLLLFSGCGAPEPPRETVTISMPYTEYIQNVDTNYYKLWLEEQTGLRIEINFITEDYTDEYLRLLFSSQDSGVDAVIFSPDQALTLRESVEQYGMSGKLLPLGDYIESHGENIREVLRNFEEYDLARALQAEDGNIYYMPSLMPSKATRNAQSMWINTAWLKAVDLRPPRTTEELRQVLQAFKEQDPNGNGIQDEVPLLGGGSTQVRQMQNFIMNAFVYTDPWNSYMAVQGGEVTFVPTTEAWRQGLIYLNSLYLDGLIPSFTLQLDDEQLSQLALDSRSLVGCFTGGGISDVLGHHSPEILANFFHVSPLEGPEGVQWATASTTQPLVGGVITAGAKNPEAVFRLMDMMMRTDASLIGRYGEPQVDWEFGKPGNIDIFGSAAALHVKNQLQNRVQNKTLAGAGPAALPEQYSDSVTWSGFQADQEYMNARAFISYQPQMPQEYIRLLHFSGADAGEVKRLRRTLDNYVAQSVTDFMSGGLDPTSDAAWDSYLAQLDSLGKERFLGAVRESYEEVDRDR